MLAESNGGADQQMTTPSDLLKSAERIDTVLQKFLQLRKCKFCGAMISERDTFCEKCGRSQV
jgi:F420-0:gamma-glutamyl ligase